MKSLDITFDQDEMVVPLKTESVSKNLHFLRIIQFFINVNHQLSIYRTDYPRLVSPALTTGLFK